MISRNHFILAFAPMLMTCSLNAYNHTDNNLSKRDKMACSALEKWIDAGPRLTTNSRNMTLPNSLDCYNGENVVTCFTVNFSCSVNVECEDVMDSKLRSELFPLSHMRTEYNFFEIFNYCLGNTKIKPRDITQVHLAKRKAAQIKLVYDATILETSVHVSYPQSSGKK